MKWQTAALMLSLLVPLAGAGSATDPELSDPAGDAHQFIECVPPSCLSGVYEPSSEASEQVDILASWFALENGTLSVSMQTVAETDDEVYTTFAFDVEATPFSASDNDTRSPVVLEAKGTTTITGTNVTWVRNGTVLTASLPMQDAGMVAGDRLVRLQVSTERSESSSESLGQGSQKDTDATDGTSRPFYAPVAAGEPDFQVTARNGTYSQSGTEQNFTGSNPWFDAVPDSITFSYQILSHQPGSNFTVQENGAEARKVTTDEAGVAHVNATIGPSDLDGRTWSVQVTHAGHTTTLAWLLGGHAFDPLYADGLSIEGLGGNWTLGNTTTEFEDKVLIGKVLPDNITVSYRIHNNLPLANLTVEYVGYNTTVQVDVLQYSNKTLSWTFQPMVNATSLEIQVRNADGQNATYTLVFEEDTGNKGGEGGSNKEESVQTSANLVSPVVWVFLLVGVVIMVVLVILVARK